MLIYHVAVIILRPYPQKQKEKRTNIIDSSPYNTVEQVRIYCIVTNQVSLPRLKNIVFSLYINHAEKMCQMNILASARAVFTSRSNILNDSRF